ncbi:MAG: hypothetical protein HY075_13455 [Deltaproteobacteria bacterium]|nr:hypothetical protein [Deltaproteobacteria bacterium]
MDSKSHDYTVVRLDREKGHEWHLLSPSSSGGQPQSSSSSPSPDDTGDLAFEHRGSGSIVSVNSVCREYRDASLEDLSKYLLLGLNTRGPVVTQDIELDGAKALESTVDAAMNQRQPSSGERKFEETPVRVRAVVLRKRSCTFDLMFVARPDVFDELLPIFNRFLKGFHAD